MKGHYDKGQRIISMVSSLPLSPTLKEYKARITQSCENKQSGESPL